MYVLELPNVVRLEKPNKFVVFFFFWLRDA